MIVFTAAIDVKRRVPRKRATSESITDIPYQFDDFFDDQKRLAAYAVDDALPAPPSHIAEDLDGRSLVIHLDPLLVAARSEQHATKTFFEKYGPTAGACRLSKFRMVLACLDRLRAELSKAGVGFDQQPMAIREEFVRYLLARKVGPGQQILPKIALTRFLDEWGHRWL